MLWTACGHKEKMLACYGQLAAGKLAAGKQPAGKLAAGTRISVMTAWGYPQAVITEKMHDWMVGSAPPVGAAAQWSRHDEM